MRDTHRRRPEIFHAIWRTVARIPRGRVATYGQIARMTGAPGGARTVGWAMRVLPDGLSIGGRDVPWHRVINALGRMSPRRASDGGDGTAAQARRLRLEGVVFEAGGRVDLSRHLWRGDRRRR